MKITRRQLLRLINESINEHITKPDVNASGIPPKYLGKIHALIDSGDPGNFNMAVSLIDGLDGDSSYAYSYRDYDKVGDLEKLGNQASDALDDPDWYDGQTAEERAESETWKAIYGDGGTIDRSNDIVFDWVNKFDDPDARRAAYNTHSERYHSVKNKPRPFLRR